MSTAYGRRLRRHFRQPLTDEILAPRPWPRRMLFAGCTGLLAVLLAPTIISFTPLASYVIERAAGQVRGTVRCRSISLGWFTPIALGGVEVRDRQGDLVAQAASVAGSSSLMGLLMNSSELGRFTVVRPEVNLVLDGTSSNVEDVLAEILADDSPSTTSFDLLVEDGVVHVDDRPAREKWDLTAVAVEGSFPRDERKPLALNLSGTVRSPRAQREGSLKGKVVWPRGDRGSASGEMKVDAQRFPLELLATLVRRAGIAETLSGELNAQLDGNWNTAGDATRQRIVASIDARDVRAAGGWLGQDQLRLASVTAPATITWQDDRLNVEKLALNCDLGELNFEGQIDTSDGLWNSLAKETYELTGEFDLARLAAALPNTIHLRENTEITDGKATLQLTSVPGDDGQHWSGTLKTSNLVATTNGRALTWEQPVQFTFDGRDSPQGLVLNHLRCQSSFLELEASGTREYLSVSSSYDLEKLSRELDQFLDLGNFQLAGDGWSHTTWRQKPDGHFELDGEVQVRNFQLVHDQAHPWHEDNLLLFLETKGRLRDGEVDEIEKAVATLESGGDRFKAEVRERLTKLREVAVWPLAIALEGELARWLPRLEPWIGGMPESDIAGQIQLQGDAQYQRGAIAIAQADGLIRGLRVHSPEWFIDEPKVNFAGSGRWTADPQRLDLDRLELKASALTVDAADVRYATSARGEVSLSGQVAYVGDLQRLQQWTFDPAKPAQWRLSGRIGGEGAIRRQGTQSEARFDSRITQLELADNAGQPWREPELRLAIESRWDHNAERISLDRLELASNAIRCSANGQVTQWDHERNLELRGQLDYNAEQLRALVQRYFGSSVEIGGRQSQNFTLRGPLRPGQGLHSVASSSTRPQSVRPVPTAPDWLSSLEGDGALGWEWANVAGFDVSGGTLRGRLRQGTLQFDPLRLSVNQGTLDATALVKLSPGPAEFRLQPGRVLDRVQVTQELCAQGIKFVAPALAGATQAQGQFSLQVDGCRVPLSDPRAADVGGTLQVHNIEIGPSPLVQELAVLLNNSSSVMLKQQSDIQFRMVNGRVYHQNLQLVFPELTIRTYGSVGLDESLALMAEMPVPPKWIGSNRLGDALRTQTIRIPITGTLSQPRLDRQVMAQLTQQLIGNTAGQAILNEVNRGLDRLLRPR